MAEAMVSTILGQLRDMAIDKATEAWTLVRGVEEEVNQLERNLRHSSTSLKMRRKNNIRAKEMQTTDHGAETSTTSVPMWMACPLWKVYVSCFSFGSEVVKRHDIATRIKDINKELDQIVKKKNDFNLTKREIIEQPRRPESTAFVDVSKLYGRDEVKEDIIRTLLCGTSEEEGSCIPTISILGMGGIGKTALAQLQIAKAILQALDPGSIILLQNKVSSQALYSSISENIEKKKFFLALDDVWIDDNKDWEQLKAAPQSRMPRSRILVTTRKESVAKHMESSCEFPLDELSDDICWKLLSKKAFAGRKKVSCENLEDIGRAIAKKCKGLPLASKTLGGLLQRKLGRVEWEEVLNNEISTSDVAGEDVFKHLFFSYVDLWQKIRRCLLYCAIFPKIDKDELVQHWMAQGYSGIESEGEEYFNYLGTCSFFQDFSKDGNGEIITCKMHDLVHDFLQFLNGFVTEEINENLTLDSSSKKRHLMLEFSGKTKISSISGAEKLRTFVAVSRGGFSRITSAALQNLFSQSKHLRLLNFQRSVEELKKFPFDIGKLIHLRYLGFVNCSQIKVLPETVCELRNLQSLNLSGCRWLEKLPVGIGKLINLRYLLTEGSDSLTYYPKGFSNLTALRRLSNIRMTVDGDDADQFSIGDLEKRDFLGGDLCVELTGNKINWDEAKRAKLENKKHLKRMEIQICSPNIKEEEVQRALNPPSNLHLVLVGDKARLKIQDKIRVALLIQKAKYKISWNAILRHSSKGMGCEGKS
ncbi:hypothetical protein DITRI_Ditri20bG0044000 [Diplodiscus trichospermus]